MRIGDILSPIQLLPAIKFSEQSMLELYHDQINIKESKARGMLRFDKHDWTDDLNIPVLILIFPVMWISLTIYDKSIFNENNLSINLCVLLLILGLYFLYQNLITTWKLRTILSELTISENRAIVLKIAEELKIETIKNNGSFFVGIHRKSFPFNQIITIVYAKNKLLFNSRNNCIGYNEKLGRPPFGLKSGEKLFQTFKSKFENVKSR